MSADEIRAAYIEGLRRLAGTLERDESIPVPRRGRSAHSPLDFGLLHDVASGEEFAAAVRALGGEGWQQEIKSSHNFTWLDVQGRIAGLWVEVSAGADKVCEPIDPQPVIERSCPALDAVIAEAQEGGAK
jgi:hypothetical protein